MDLEAEANDGLTEWEQIQSPWDRSSSATVAGSATTAPAAGWDDGSAVVVRDDYIPNYCSVFPPSKHEGLPPLPAPSQGNHIDQHPQEPLPSSSSPPPSPDVESEHGDEVAPTRDAVGSWWRVRGCFGSVVWVTGALVASFVYVKIQWWRRRFRQANEDRLMVVIRERDQKIKKLLQQIAQMNEQLSARRRVSVVRVA
ncbi:hypothetical protein NMG60_11036129 [Bertholletia excelsa]